MKKIIFVMILTLQGCGYVNCEILEYKTRVSKMSCSCIDYFYSNDTKNTLIIDAKKKCDKN